MKEEDVETLLESHDHDLAELERYIMLQDAAIAKQRDEIVSLYDQVEKLWNFVHDLAARR